LRDARPSRPHHALASLEQAGRIDCLITQNVDGLHQRAGSSRLIELHGNAWQATCLACGAPHARTAIQRVLETDNPRCTEVPPARGADGDPDVGPVDLDAFRIPVCTVCGGTLKPDVVFFGECVPTERVDAARAALERADAVLVVGSSLMVYSGYRFCEWAARLGKPIAAINLGRTRADALLALKVELPCGEALVRAVAGATPRPSAA
jgi:NAD-dependent SIR2 family protein deacetylase